MLSIKTGGCPETCTYCSQSSSWSKSTGLKAEKLMGLDEVYQVRHGLSLLTFRLTRRYMLRRSAAFATP